MFNFPKKDKKEPKDLKGILRELKSLKENFAEISEEVERIKGSQAFSVQKVGIVRFNPFKEVGGDQSFALALLDKNDSGVVITSLYSREGNRVYGKPIKGGVSEHTLSEEEKKAIEVAGKLNGSDKK